ncbi:MAG: hypothetical protein WCR63_05610 [Bacilli bacterium]|jgi:hypothetical protein
MTIDEFYKIHGQTIMCFQIIENDLKWIYSLMKAGDVNVTYASISKCTLGEVVSMLKELDKSSGEQFISDNDYNFLRQMKEKRNYWCHRAYIDFMYEPNWDVSTEYENVCQRLLRDNKRIMIVYKNVEQAKIEANKVFAR